MEDPMQLTTVRQDEEFRERVRTWLAEHVPSEPPPPHGPGLRAFDMAWQRAQYDAGYAGVSWPAEYGGCGLGLVQQLIWFEEYARAHAPDIGCSFVGINHAGPTLIAEASDAQKSYHLRRILRGESAWCQGFSEPGAGSDLASLSMRGVMDGDELVITGQKIWTSFGDLADFQELLVRTEPSSQRHHGLSWIICDMRAPGIDVRPIRSMAGVPEFCEVFYDEVRLPLANVVGGLGNGWKVAMSTLSFERGTGFVREQLELARHVTEMAERMRAAGQAGRPAADGMLARVATAAAEVRAMYAMTLAMISRSARGQAGGTEASMIRLYYSELRQRVERLAIEMGGADALALAGEPAAIAAAYLDSFKVTIGAGTKDIQRNIIGERGLGLPKS
jgi:alkylation response protein AidB-like acyl-CoA dehydrogenase